MKQLLLMAALLFLPGCPKDGDQPDMPPRLACNFDESPLCPGTQVCVITCEDGAAVEYCREPDPVATELGEKCVFGSANCREGGCMQEPQAKDGPRCTAFCVDDGDCPMDTHCVPSNFSFQCLRSDSFDQSLCRPLSVKSP